MRLALGATRSAAVWLVVRDALVTIGAGTAVGISPAVTAGAGRGLVDGRALRRLAVDVATFAGDDSRAGGRRTRRVRRSRRGVRRCCRRWSRFATSRSRCGSTARLQGPAGDARADGRRRPTARAVGDADQRVHRRGSPRRILSGSGARGARHAARTGRRASPSCCSRRAPGRRVSRPEAARFRRTAC